MSADKQVVLYGLLAKAEGSYGGGATVAATADGIQLAELPELEVGWAYEGEAPPAPGTYGLAKRRQPTGKTIRGVLRVEGKGAGVAYSASVKPPDVHNLLLASGFSATTVTTGGSESVTYAPTAGPTGFGSLAGEMYSRGEKWPFTGLYANCAIVGENPGPAIFEFDSVALLGTRADSAVPTITYTYASIIPPKNENITLSLNAVTTLKVRSYRFETGASIDNPRINLNTTNAHAGFVRARRAPKLTVTVEAPLSSLLDVYTIEEAATNFAVSMTVGGTQYNKFSLSLPQAQLRARQTVEGPVALHEIECFAYCSTPTANDDVSLVFN